MPPALHHDREFLGVGWTFPAAGHARTARIAQARYEQRIEESIC